MDQKKKTLLLKTINEIREFFNWIKSDKNKLSTSTSTEYPLSLRISLAVGSNTILLWNRFQRLSINFIYVEVGEIPQPVPFEPCLEDRNLISSQTLQAVRRKMFQQNPQI